MILQPALFYQLSHDGTIIGLVSTRIYPAGDVPTGAKLPYITYQRIDAIHERHMTGGCNWVHARYQLDCWAMKPRDADEVFEAVKVALDNFRGIMGAGATVATIDGCFLESDSSGVEPPEDATQRGTARVSADFVIWYRDV